MKKYFTVQDLFDIRAIAQELVKQGYSNKEAVRIASERVRYGFKN